MKQFFEHYDKLQKYVEEGLVLKNDHPTLPLSIYNYSRTAQYDKVWDEVTLRARGLILDNKGTLIAQPFPKFFNYEELTPERKLSPPFNTNEKPLVFEKMDGSLGIIYYYDGWNVATRGSFMSEQAIKGREMLDEYSLNKFNPNLTYLSEIIYPDNRIVVKYDDSRLTFLSIMSGSTELKWSEFVDEMERLNIPLCHIVRKYNLGFDYDVLKNSPEENHEGYVVKFEPSSYRVKIKFDEYVRLHRLMTNTSSYDIWDALRTGIDMNDFLKDIPDEFDEWVRSVISDLKIQFFSIAAAGSSVVDDVTAKFTDRKDIAQYLQTHVDRKYHAVVFNMLDGIDPADKIWRMIKPDYQKPDYSQR